MNHEDPYGGSDTAEALLSGALLQVLKSSAPQGDKVAALRSLLVEREPPFPISDGVVRLLSAKLKGPYGSEALHVESYAELIGFFRDLYETRPDSSALACVVADLLLLDGQAGRAVAFFLGVADGHPAVIYSASGDLQELIAEGDSDEDKVRYRVAEIRAAVRDGGDQEYARELFDDLLRRHGKDNGAYLTSLLQRPEVSADLGGLNGHSGPTTPKL
jgi:hypothetical protein